MIMDDIQYFFEHLLIGSANFDADVAGIGLALADFDVLQIEGASVSQNFIEHLGEQERVDDVPLNFHFLNGPGRTRLSHEFNPIWQLLFWRLHSGAPRPALA